VNRQGLVVSRDDMAKSEGLSKKGSALFIIFELVMVVLYAIFVQHEPFGNATSDAHHHNASSGKERRSAPSSTDHNKPFDVGEYAGKLVQPLFLALFFQV
jgi:hypothetical protein